MIVQNNRLFAFLREWRFIILLAVVFLILRLPGIQLPYHQDEWKNVATSATVDGAGSFFTHPPLMQISFVAAHYVFGESGFRIFPLLFSAASGILLFAVVRNRAGKNAAAWALALFTVCFYGILGSLVPDVDGAIIPFFFILSVYFYDKFNESIGSNRWRWLILLIASLLVGLLIKLNFILVAGALAIDYVWGNWRSLTAKKISSGVVGMVGFGVLYVVLLYAIQAVYPAFSISAMFDHANQYTGVGRNWLQIAVQGIKALFYLSPLLVVPLMFSSREIFNKARVFFIYLIAGLFFYFIMFDFSRGALDKYAMFAVVPLVVTVGIVFAKIFENLKKRSGLSEAAPRTFSSGELKWPIAIGLASVILLVVLNFLPHNIVALYPKTEWFARAIHGEWNILNPFTGGSGPVGFYVSFLFIVLSFILSAIFGLAGVLRKEWRKGVAVVFLMVGITYNAVFAEELLFGKINGSPSRVLHEAVAFIGKSESIKKVMTYNDTGNQYLSKIGKYGGRIYATPESESGHREKFAKFDGQYMVIDIPHLYEDGFYGRFFAQCDVLFETNSGKITGRVYDCDQTKRPFP